MGPLGLFSYVPQINPSRKREKRKERKEEEEEEEEEADFGSEERDRRSRPIPTTREKESRLVDFSEFLSS